MNSRYFFPVLLLPLMSCPVWAVDKFPAATVGGVSIKGLTREEATRRLKRELAPRLERKVELVAGTKVVFRRRSELGYTLDIGKMLARVEKGEKRAPVMFALNDTVTKKAFGRLQSHLMSSPHDAKPILIGNIGKKVHIHPEQSGKRIDADSAATHFIQEAQSHSEQTRFQIPTQKIAPRLTRQKLKGVDAILASFTTRFNPGQVKRTNNMRVALKSIDGTLLSPKEVFSLNNTVGERTQARGYRTAIIFEDGKEKPGLGGGVSQITGTLFNAALVAGLSIVTYRVHSRPVAYLPIARDATVSWGNFDMKFKNDTHGPIYISYKISGNHLTATLFGHKTGRTTKISRSVKRNKPRDISAKLFRVIYVDGKAVKHEQVGSSHYNWKADNDD